jgi:hypothetical protein
MMNEDNLKIMVEGFSRMPEGDKKNQVVIPIRIPPLTKYWQYLW